MPQSGQEIAGYKLLNKIGEGGMGQVFLAEQIRLRRQVAIKLVLLDVKSETPGRAEPVEELTREAQALMALEHPHILSLYDAGRVDDTAYLVMPYIPEGSFQDALRPGPRQQLQLPLPPAEALLYIEQAAAALQYAHDRNFVHRDIKPANFLIRSLSRSTTGSGRTTKRLHLFLADFGLSRFLAFSTNTTHLAGTPTYMAPEQFQGKVTPASDQYSLAILFFYLLTGDLPYHGSPIELMFHHVHDTPPSPAERVEGIPTSLASVVQRALAKTPEERYPSISSMAEAAREALVGAGIVPSQDSFPVAAVRPPDLQSGPSAEAQTPPLPPTLVVSPQAAPANRWTEPAGLSEGLLPTVVESHEGSLPTLREEKPGLPTKPPRREQPAPQDRPPRRAPVAALAALAAIILLGAVFGAGALLHIGPFQTGAANVQSTQTTAPTVTPGQTATSAPTATLTPATPTPVPASAILDSILAQEPAVNVNLNQGDAPWNRVMQLDPSRIYRVNTPPGEVRLLNGILTYSARTFPTPLAIAVDFRAPSDERFFILLDTTRGSSHLYYRAQLTNNAPPEAAHSTNNQNFTVAGRGTAVNTTWANGSTHTLMLVLDGTRLLFFLDKQLLVDAAIPQPNPTARLSLATLDMAYITGIRQYNVP